MGSYLRRKSRPLSVVGLRTGLHSTGSQHCKNRRKHRLWRVQIAHSCFRILASIVVPSSDIRTCIHIRNLRSRLRYFLVTGNSLSDIDCLLALMGTSHQEPSSSNSHGFSGLWKPLNVEIDLREARAEGYLLPSHGSKCC